MNSKSITNFSAQNYESRSGVTLSEVLVSLVIMSVGVVLLSTLLPISILRTAQATQLTHAVFLRNNAEALIESTSSATSSILGDSQIPHTAVPPVPVSAVVDPLGAFLTTTATPQFFGYPTTYQRTSGGATSIAQADGLVTLPDSWTLVRDDFVTGFNFSASPPTLTLRNATTDLNVRNGLNNSYAPFRIIMFDAFNNAIIRQLCLTSSPAMTGTVVGANQVSWENIDGFGNPVTAAPILPTAFTPVRARIQYQDRRYTWLMTVRKQWIDSGATDWIAEVDVAVFFNRSFNLNEEFEYQINLAAGYGLDGAPGVASVDDDNDGITDWTDSPTNTVPDLTEVGWPGSDDYRTVTVTVQAGAPATGPSVKKGSYMLEPSQMAWYRIVDIHGTTLLLDRDIPLVIRNSTFSGIFMKGIVDVYSLGTRTGTQ